MKEEMDKFFHIIENYVEQQDYFDVIYSKKFGYIRVAAIESFYPDIQCLHTPEEMLDILFCDVINNIILSPDNPSEESENMSLTEYEETESRWRIKEVLEAVENKEDKAFCFNYLDQYIAKFQEESCQLPDQIAKLREQGDLPFFND